MAKEIIYGVEIEVDENGMVELLTDRGGRDHVRRGLELWTWTKDSHLAREGNTVLRVHKNEIIYADVDAKAPRIKGRHETAVIVGKYVKKPKLSKTEQIKRLIETIQQMKEDMDNVGCVVSINLISEGIREREGKVKKLETEMRAEGYELPDFLKQLAF